MLKERRIGFTRPATLPSDPVTIISFFTSGPSRETPVEHIFVLFFGTSFSFVNFPAAREGNNQMAAGT